MKTYKYVVELKKPLWPRKLADAMMNTRDFTGVLISVQDLQSDSHIYGDTYRVHWDGRCVRCRTSDTSQRHAGSPAIAMIADLQLPLARRTMVHSTVGTPIRTRYGHLHEQVLPRDGLHHRECGRAVILDTGVSFA